MGVASLNFLHHAIVFEYSLMNLFGGVYWNIKLTAQAAHRLYMVRVVVGDDNIANAVHGYAVVAECLFQASHSYARIDKYSVVISV